METVVLSRPEFGFTPSNPGRATYPVQMLALELLTGTVHHDFPTALLDLQFRAREEFGRSELYQRWMAKVRRVQGAGGRLAVDTPEDALGERETLCAHLVLDPGRFEVVLIPDSCKSKEWAGVEPHLRQQAALYGLYELLAASEVFFWHNEITIGAQAMTLPDHVFGREGFQTPFMWWTFGNALEFEGVSSPVDGLLIIGFVDRVGLFYFFGASKTTDRVMQWELHEIFYGEKITELHAHAWVLKLVAFLNSKYVSATSTKIERGLRRRIEKSTEKKIEAPRVRVIQLRTKTAKPGDPEVTVAPAGSGPDWAGRWWVRGHIRAQWCPSTKTHKVIWIAPHLKGPEEKPILGRLYNVAR